VFFVVQKIFLVFSRTRTFCRTDAKEQLAYYKKKKVMVESGLSVNTERGIVLFYGVVFYTSRKNPVSNVSLNPKTTRRKGSNDHDKKNDC
jgi:hypothetical protein